MRKTARVKKACDLHVHSTFSLLDGFGSPKNVVARAVELGWGAAALTEHGHMGSVPPFYRACREARIKPILGEEFYTVSDEILGVRDKEVRKSARHLTVLALSAEGYKNLVAWSTFSMQPENFYYRPRISLNAMIERAPQPLHHNVFMTGCLGGELAQLLIGMKPDLYAASCYIDSMKTIFPNFYIEIQNHGHPSFMDKGFVAYEGMCEAEDRVRERLLRLAAITRTPVVLTNDSHYQTVSQRKAHISMLSSKMKNWAKEDTHRVQSDEHQISGFVRDYCYWTAHLQSMEELEERTDGLSGACDNIMEIVKESNVRLSALDSFSYSIPFSGYDNPIEKIRNLSSSRLKGISRKHGKIAKERFEHELSAMGDFAHYLLLMSYFIRTAAKQGILTNTRGSASSSLVCYCLSIHDVDPIADKLTFERFYNPQRKKLPDIDIDIEHDRYDDFMKIVLERMVELEGEGQVAMIGNYQTLANRSSFRLVAESLGISKEIQDEIANLLPQMIDSGMVDEEEDVYTALKDTYPEIYELASEVFDNLKSVGQHACGWVFGTAERPLKDWVPMYLIASSGKLVTQFDYKNIEKFGFNKGDFLRLKNLSVISRCLSSLGKNPLDLRQIPTDDPETFKMLRSGRTEGVFTLQGSTNRQGCIEVEVEKESDVIASVAIYRPSLTRPGYHTIYNRRRKGIEEVDYTSKVVKDVLEETYGIPIFQEQILELGYEVGLDHDEAQQLLDAIKLAKGVGRGAKEAFGKFKPIFMKKALKKVSQGEADEVWELMNSFQGYGFARAHATSYGRLAVKSAYLKCHHPQEFFVSLLDVYPEKHRYIAAAKDEGFKLLPPDVNLSAAGFTRGPKSTEIFVGLARVRGIGPVALRAILAKQPYSSLEDFRERLPKAAVKQPSVEALAAVGAFRSFGIKPTDSDEETLHVLGFLLNHPKAMDLKTMKPKHAGRRESSRGWKHLGLERKVPLTPRGASVSKLFWVPNLPAGDILKKKASAMGRGKSWLLLVVDENGLPFELIVDEAKTEEYAYLKFMAEKCRGAVFCFDGSIRNPFNLDGPLGFRFFDVTGTMQEEPQCWGIEDENYVKAFNLLHKRKRRARSQNASKA
jgi:DNA polymerase-3 subunit alpha